jgi:hypothetical protein
MLHAFWALVEHGSLGGHHVVRKTLSPLIIYLIELEISRQFLGKLASQLKQTVDRAQPLCCRNAVE